MKNIIRIIIILAFAIILIQGYKYAVKVINESMIAYKPVIYIYPEKEQTVSIKLHYPGKLFCTYPEYQGEWLVKAKPGGILINQNDKREYSYLFYEGELNIRKWDLTEGFVVRGQDTKEFLQNKLSELGLQPKEYNEFIVFWLPQMQGNNYNLIHFAGEEYEKIAPLEISPQPDSLLRVFMVYKPIKEPVEIKPQEFKTFTRKGLTVIEWGGTKL